MVPQRTRVGLSTGGVYLNNILSISVEGDTNVALRNDGTVFTWGRNSNGQGGDGTTVLKRYPNPVLTSVSNDGVTLRKIATIKADDYTNRGNATLGDRYDYLNNAPIFLKNVVSVDAWLWPMKTLLWITVRSVPSMLGAPTATASWVSVKPAAT